MIHFTWTRWFKGVSFSRGGYGECRALYIGWMQGKFTVMRLDD